MPTKQEILDQAILDEDVETLAKIYFDFDLSQGQIELIADIVHTRHRRISISAMTRYGKTQCVAIAIALRILRGDKIKVAFIAPQQEQASILRQYMSELIMNCPELMNLAQIEVEQESKLTKEASKKRMTFKTGAEYRVFSAEGDANRLMGSGGDIIVADEAALISRKAYAKIGRMLGDNPKDSILIELYNPWGRDNVAFEHTLDPAFKKFHIGWEQAVAEGRTTLEFVEERKKELTPIEFTVLYESRFPDQSDDAMFNLAKIELAEHSNMDIEEELKGIEALLAEAHKHTEAEVAKAKRDLKPFKRIISCDPADMGLDSTVIYWGTQKDNHFQVCGVYSEAKSDSMNIVGRIIDKAKEFIGRKVPGLINIDRIGIGAGAFSRLKEVVKEQNLQNIKVLGCHFGEKAIKEDHYQNKKAENYFRLQSLINDGLVRIPQHRDLKTQLLAMKWELNSSSKRRIIDPEKSPDFADALVFFTWRDNIEFLWDFV